MLKKLDNKAFHPVILLPIAIMVGLSIWLFFWPLVECYYAWSWEPLLAGSIQYQSGFIVGGIVFAILVYFTKKIIF